MELVYLVAFFYSSFSHLLNINNDNEKTTIL